MNIDLNTVEYIAELSKIELSDIEKDKLVIQLKELVSYFNMLSTLDIENTEPLSHLFDISNVLREDKVMPSFSKEDILANAPKSNGNSFVVPKTVE